MALGSLVSHISASRHGVLIISDASAGHLVLSVTDSRISMESKSQGESFVSQHDGVDGQA